MPKRVRVRAKARREPKSEAECLEEVRKKQVTGFELLKFLYDCLKGKR